jgi:hypothetical protein
MWPVLDAFLLSNVPHLPPWRRTVMLDDTKVSNRASTIIHFSKALEFKYGHLDSDYQT